MQAATSLKSLSISSRLSLGFGCMLVLLVAVAAVGQLSVGKVHEQMRQITGIGANKAKLVNESGFPYDATALIEAVCRGWETFD